MSDPTVTFLARVLRTEVRDARSERLPDDGNVELERLRWAGAEGEGALVMRRPPADAALEPQLLPFLARKTDRVPRVFARGLPPASAQARPWVLVEDLVAAPSACRGEATSIARAKAAVERAVTADGPALRALGVAARTPAAIAAALDDARAREAAERLASWPERLVHGELTCARAVLAPRGVVLCDWGRAYLGCGLLDIARISADAGDDPALWRAYAAVLGRELTGAEIDAAVTLEGLARAGGAL